MPTVSIVKGHGYSKHNDRSIKNIDPENRSWNPELSSQNIVIKNENIKQKYHDLFDDALEKYNAKQTQSSRQIKNYYEKISRSKQEKTFYELIVSIGDMESIPKGSDIEKKSIKAISEYAEGFADRNKNFEVFQNIIHLDEKGVPHVHIDFIPVSTGNKRGLETKNSLGGALKEMGFGRNGFEVWRAKELDTMVEIMKNYDLEYEIGTGRTEHFKSTSEYKKYVEERKIAEQKIQTLNSEIKELKQEKKSIIENPLLEVAENNSVQNILDSCLNHSSEPTDISKFDYLDDAEIEIQKSFIGNKINVVMPYDHWEKIKTEHNNLIDRFKNLKENFMNQLHKIQNILDRVFELPSAIKMIEFSNLKEKLKSIINERDFYKEKYHDMNSISSRIEKLFKLNLSCEEKLFEPSEIEHNKLNDNEKLDYILETSEIIFNDYPELLETLNNAEVQYNQNSKQIKKLKNTLTEIVDHQLEFAQSQGLESEFIDYLRENELLDLYSQLSKYQEVEQQVDEYELDI